MYKNKYLKYKNKYLDLKNQIGGDIRVSATYRANYDKYQNKFNLSHFLDKGTNNIWFSENDLPFKNDNTTKLEEDHFHKTLRDIMNKRYKLRQTYLKNLSDLSSTNSNLMNFDFVSYFFHYIYRGSSHKLQFPTGLDYKYPDDTNVYSEIIKTQKEKVEARDEAKDVTKTLGKQGQMIRHFIFLDKKNPCHITQAVKKFKGPKNNFYKFKVDKIIGTGKAGTAMLFNYNEKMNEDNIENKWLALKVMAGNQFNLENKGSHLDLDIAFFENRKDHKFPGYTTFGNRYYFPTRSINNQFDSRWPGFSRYNIFKSDIRDEKHQFKYATLSVPSDNFTNQTIISMIINLIMSEMRIENYVHQYDAFLCLNIDTFANITDVTAADGKNVISKSLQSLFNGITNAGKYFVESVANALDTTTENVEISGATIMEIANKGDLNSFINDLHLKFFKDIELGIVNEEFKDQFIGFLDKLPDFDETEITDDGVLNFIDYSMDQHHPAKLDSPVLQFVYLNAIFNDIMMQIMKPLDILHSSQFAFVHGDMKSKNIFVHRKEDGSIIYKLADFDKSSINFKGVRFYNSGDKHIKVLKNLIAGPLAQVDSKELHADRQEQLHEVDEAKKNIPLDEAQIEKTKGEVLGNIHEETTYKLSGFITAASRFKALSSLEKVEVEQFSVRYLPIPYYQTLDIYTFILSLFFTKIFYIYIVILDNLERHYKSHDAASLDKLVRHCKIYNAFRLLFSPLDRTTIIKYFEIYYNSDLLEEVSINAILDPIKKNNIQLRKRYPDEFREIFNMKWALSTDAPIKKFLFGALKKGEEPELWFSRGTILPNSEQLCLHKKPYNFERNFFRSGYVMYTNAENNLQVYNSASTSEAFAGIDTKTLDEDLFKLVVDFINEAINPSGKFPPKLQKRLEEKIGLRYNMAQVSVIINKAKPELEYVIQNQKRLAEAKIILTDRLSIYSDGKINICKTPVYKTFAGTYTWDYKEQLSDDEQIPYFTIFVENIVKIANEMRSQQQLLRLRPSDPLNARLTVQESKSDVSPKSKLNAALDIQESYFQDSK